MTKSLVFFLFLLAATISEALEVTARSGEHDGFTRVVFYIGQKARWTSKHKENGIELSFNGDAINLEASDFHRRLNQGRVEKIFVAPEGDRIVLEFGCRCSADQFSTKDGLLVYDIKPDLAKSVKKTQAPKPKLPMFFEEPPENPMAIASGFEVEKPMDAQTSGGVAHIRNFLFEALTAASDANILQKDKQANITPPPPVENSDLMPANMAISDGFDSGHLTIDSDLPLTQRGENCPTNLELNLFEWAGKTAFNAEVAAARSQLTGEFDDIDSGAVERLAKLYLAFGFGAEARQTIEAFQTKQDHEKLLAIADILENRKQAEPSFFRGYASCNTHAAMWSILSQENLSKETDLNIDAVTFATMSLPPKLKPRLGTLVAERVFEAGYSDLSEFILGHIEQTNSGSSFSQSLILAKLRKNAGQIEEAIVLLEAQLNSDTLIPPEALIELIDLKILLDHPIETKLAEMAELLAWQHKGETIGERLQQYQVKALVMAGDFRQALKKYKEIPKSHEINSDFTKLITFKAPDVAFLEATFSINFPISDTALSEMVIRLIDLEFWQQAETILTRRGPRPVTDPLRIAKARIALNRQEPQQALALLQGLSDQSALKVKAQAFMELNQFDKAGHLFANLSDTQGRAVAAWRGQNTMTLKRIGNLELAAFLDLEAYRPDKSMPLLAQNHLLIDNSQQMRLTLEAALASLQNIGQ